MGLFIPPRWFEVTDGGLTIAAPSALVDHNGTLLRLFITGPDNGIWENDYDGNNWSGWDKISGPPLTASAPAAVELSGVMPELFVKSEDGRIYECSF